MVYYFILGSHLKVKIKTENIGLEKIVLLSIEYIDRVGGWFDIEVFGLYST